MVLLKQHQTASAERKYIVNYNELHSIHIIRSRIRMDTLKDIGININIVNIFNKIGEIICSFKS